MTSNLRILMQESLGLSQVELNQLILRSPHAYKVYTIPKKSGGERTIAQPAKETKFAQRWLIDNIFNNLPIHECATAYKQGASIKINAATHRHNPYITKFDFKDFFRSIKENDLISHFALYLGANFSTAEIRDIARISCIKPKGATELALSIGAPSSPILSNSVMYEFDSCLNAWCIKNNIVYTRYADDLTLSTKTKGISSEVENVIRATLREINYPSLKLNNKKTTHVSKKFQRRVTGIILNNEGEISLGRDRKRAISAQIHRFSLGLISDDDIFALQGILGFAKDIEPIFIKRMSEKYSNEVIEKIFKARKK